MNTTSGYATVSSYSVSIIFLLQFGARISQMAVHSRKERESGCYCHKDGQSEQSWIARKARHCLKGLSCLKYVILILQLNQSSEILTHKTNCFVAEKSQESICVGLAKTSQATAAHHQHLVQLVGIISHSNTPKHSCICISPELTIAEWSSMLKLWLVKTKLQKETKL